MSVLGCECRVFRENLSLQDIHDMSTYFTDTYVSVVHLCQGNTLGDFRDR